MAYLLFALASFRQMAHAPPVPISDSEKSMSAPEDEANDEQSGHKPRASFM